MKKNLDYPASRYCDFDREVSAFSVKPYAAYPGTESNLFTPLLSQAKPNEVIRKSVRNTILELLLTLIAGACLVVALVGSPTV